MTKQDFKVLLDEVLKRNITKDDLKGIENEIKNLDRRISRLTTEVVITGQKTDRLEETVKDDSRSLNHILTGLDGIAHLAKNNYDEITLTGNRLKDLEKKAGIKY